MNIQAIGHMLAYLLIILGAAMGACWGVGLYFQDPVRSQAALLGLSLGGLLSGTLLIRWTRQEEGSDLSVRDGIGIVAFGWLLLAVFGSTPYLLGGVIAHPAAAVFESVSGFTTTGASVIAAPELVPKGILLWRSTTNMLGGMGVLVLCVAILPFLGSGGMQVFRAEVTGVNKDRLTPRITSTAKLLWMLYAGLILLNILLLRVGSMGWFDSVCHAFGTVATGGFSTHTKSIGEFQSLYIEVVTVVFMLLGGTNFFLIYAAVHGRPMSMFRDSEFRLFLGCWLGASLLITGNLWFGSSLDGGNALRAAVFTTTSLMTTTGFATADFDTWPTFSRLLLMLTMLIGACSGSTCGAIKMERFLVMLKKIWLSLRQFVQPRLILQLKMNREPVPPIVIDKILVFILLYLLTVAVAGLLMTPYTTNLTSAFSSVIATMGGVGPGLSQVGPMVCYDTIPSAGQVILTVCMLLGRLEFYTLLALIAPSFWRK